MDEESEQPVHFLGWPPPLAMIKVQRKASRIPLACWDQIENGIWSVAVIPYVEKKPLDSYRTGKPDLRREPKRKFEARLFSAAYAIAFFGALWVGEVVAEATSSGTTRSLLLKDVQVSSSGVMLRVDQGAVFGSPVWICGHSIVHWARLQSASSGFMPNLGLPSWVRVSWLSRRGMCWQELMPLLKAKAALLGPPNILIIQLGESDLASRKSVDLLWNMRKVLDELAALFSRTALFWSSLLKRKVWRGAHNIMAFEKSRKLLNRAVARKVRFMNGLVIYHDDIQIGDQTLIRDDGVHLSDRGNNIWLANISNSLRDWLQL
ncbi:uncharacterized protein LOC144325325 [Podarcis muralis]